MERIVEQGRLFDFYGELLTPHQQKLYQAAVYDDLSLSEIAEQEGISRQGVHDIIRRATKTLQSYEDKLHMIARFDRIQAHTGALEQAAGEADPKQLREAVRKAVSDIREDLL